MAMTASKLTVPGFPRFPCMWSFLIMTFPAVLAVVFPGQGEGGGGMIERPVTVHTGGPDGFIFNRFFYGSIGGGYRGAGMTLHAVDGPVE